MIAQWKHERFIDSSLNYQKPFVKLPGVWRLPSQAAGAPLGFVLRCIAHSLDNILDTTALVHLPYCSVHQHYRHHCCCSRPCNRCSDCGYAPC
jgi:hypothetical protein